MSYRPESIPPLTPDQLASLLSDDVARDGATRASSRGRDPDFEARSRRDTALANELYRCVREVQGVVAAAPLEAGEAERARAAMDRFERALLELLRYHGT